MLLPDINVWLALTFDSHVHHPAAKLWFDGLSGQSACFCRTTQQGFLRLSTNSKVFGRHALTQIEAWQKYDLFRSDSRILYVDEPADVETFWRSLTQKAKTATHLWTDAYLAAFTIAANLELLSFDRDIAKHPGVRCTILS